MLLKPKFYGLIVQIEIGKRKRISWLDILVTNM